MPGTSGGAPDEPDPRGGVAIAASAAVTVVAAFLAAVAYVVVITLVTSATGRPTLVVVEAVVILLCAACLGLVRRLLQRRVDQRLFDVQLGLADGQFTMPGGRTGLLIRMATGAVEGSAPCTSASGGGWPGSPAAPTP